jgi:hypothetical protein
VDPKGNLAAFVRWIMRDVTYHKHYPCTVVRQDGMLLDLKPDDPKIAGPGLGRVPLRVGLPGFTVKVPNGARVMLSFDNGDPAAPAASLFDPGSVTEITFADGSQAIARQGDLVESGGVGAMVTLLPVPPALAGPVATGVPYLVSFGPPGPVQFPLFGSIATGRLEFKS